MQKATGIPKIKVVVAIVGAMSVEVAADNLLLDTSASFQTSAQSIWGSGDAFIFNYSQFVGVTADPSSTTINPSRFGSSGYYIDPYFLYDSKLRAGIQLGAQVNGGSIDANLDYNIQLQAPDVLRVGEKFSLTSSFMRLDSSSFTTTAANASAYLDGVLDVDVDLYSRFEVERPFSADLDLRLGNKGFTNGSTSNRPYYALADIHEQQEIISINRNESGVLRYLGGSDLSDGDLLYDSVGTGSSVDIGPLSFTAGNWNTNVDASQQAGVLQGSAEETLVTAALDIDQLIVGSPVLGLGLEHDWSVVSYDIGYDIVDLTASLGIGLKQDFTVNDELMVTLLFSEDVLIDGVGEVDSFTGSVSLLPDLTLLSEQVLVDVLFFVDASLTNDTDITFDGSLDLTVFEARLKAFYDFGAIGGSGTIINRQLGPFYENGIPVDLGAVDVYSDEFDLEGFQFVDAGSFTLQAVPVPPAIWMFATACVGLFSIARSRRPATI